MQDWHSVGQGLRDNITLLLVIVVAAGLLAGWVVFQTLRGAEDRREMDRLRRRLEDLEIERAHAYSNPGRSNSEAFTDPVVLTPRWVRKGGAATTSDGGCLIIVNDTAERSQKARLTVRIDGVAVHVDQAVRAGHSVRAEGNMGLYTVLIGAVEPLQAQLSVSLRSRHVQSA